jgi:predicted dehydrogenase
VVVGTGSIGLRHIRVLRSIPGVRVLAMPVRPQRRAELVNEGVDVVADWRDAALHGATYAVVATDTGRHVADAEAALAAGCDVLVEKPLAVDADSARRLTVAATAAVRRVAVGCCLRFLTGMRQVRVRIPALGRVHAVRIECQSYLPDWRVGRDFRASYTARPDEGGVLRDLIHEIDYATWLFGWPSAVYAELMNTGRLEIASEEAADLLWSVDGIAVSLRLDYLSRPPRRQLALYGEQGCLHWDLIQGVVTVSLDGSDTLEDVSEHPDDKYRAQADAFLHVRAGAPDERLAWADAGVRALAVCDAARRSAGRGSRVAVEYLK